MIERIPTGKTRFRLQKRLFRSDVLVLQIEIHETGRYTDCIGGVIDTNDVDRYIFRDATIGDLYHFKFDMV